MPSQIKLRRDTSTNWWTNNPALAEGEPGYETDSGQLKIGKADDTGALLTWRNLDYVSSGPTTASVSGIHISSYSFNLDNMLNFSLVGTSITNTAEVRIMDGTEVLSNTDITNRPDGLYNITLPSGTYFTTDTTYTIDIRDKATGILYLWDVFTYSPPATFRIEFNVTSAPKTCSPKSIALTYGYKGPAVDVKFVVYTAGDVVLYQTDFITISRYATAGTRSTRYFIESPTNFPVGINCRVAIYKRNGAALYNPPTDIPIQALSISNLYVNNSSSFNVSVSNISSYLAIQAQVIYGSTIIWNQEPTPPTRIGAITNTGTLVPGQSFSSYGTYKFIILFEDLTTLETPFTYNRAIEDFQVQITENNKFNLYAILVNITSVRIELYIKQAGAPPSYTIQTSVFNFNTATNSANFRQISPNTYFLNLNDFPLQFSRRFDYNEQYSFKLISQEDTAISLFTDATPVSTIVNSDTDTVSFTNAPLLFSGNRAKIQYYWRGPKYNSVILRCLVKASEVSAPTAITLSNDATSVSTTLPYSSVYTALEINLYSKFAFTNNYMYAIQFTVGSDTITSAYTTYTSTDLELIQFEGTINTLIKKQITSLDNNSIYLYLRITENLAYYSGYVTRIYDDNYFQIGTAANVPASTGQAIVRFARYNPVTNIVEPVSVATSPTNIIRFAYNRTYIIGVRRTDGTMLYSNPLIYRFSSPSVSNLSITNAGDVIDFDWTHGALVNSSDTRMRYLLMVNNQRDRYAESIDTGLILATYTPSGLDKGVGHRIIGVSYTTSSPGSGVVRYSITYQIAIADATKNITDYFSNGLLFLATALVPFELNQEGLITSLQTDTISTEPLIKEHYVTIRVDNPPGFTGATLTMDPNFPGLTAIKNTSVSFKSAASLQGTLSGAQSIYTADRILYQMTFKSPGIPSLSLTIGQYVSISGFTNSVFNTSGIVHSFYEDTGTDEYDYSRFYVLANIQSGLSETAVAGAAIIPTVRLTLNPDAYYYIKAENTTSIVGFEPDLVNGGFKFSTTLSGTAEVCNSLGLKYYRSEIKGITVAYTSLTNATVTVQRAGQIAPYSLTIEETATSSETSAVSVRSTTYNITDTTTPNISTSVVLSGTNEFKIGKYYRPVLNVTPNSIPAFVFGKTSTVPRYIYDSAFVNANSPITFTSYSSSSGADGTKLYASFPYKGPPARVFFVLTDSSDPDNVVTTYNVTPKLLGNTSPSATINITGDSLSTRLVSGKTYTASLYFNTISNNADRHIADFVDTKTYQYIASSYILTITGVGVNSVTANFEWIGHDIKEDLTVQIKNTSTNASLTLTDNTISPGTSGTSSTYTFRLATGVFTPETITYRLSVVALPDNRETPPSSDFVYASLAYIQTAQSSLFKDKSGANADRLGVAETVGRVTFSSGTNNVLLRIQLVRGSGNTVVAEQTYTITVTNSIRTTTFLSNLLTIGSSYNIKYILTADGKPQVDGYILASSEIYDPYGYDILVFAGQSNMAGIDNAVFYGEIVGGVRVYKAANSVPVPYEIATPPQITSTEKTTVLTDTNNKNVQILTETVETFNGDTTAYALDDAKGPFKSSENSENTPPNNINIPYQFTKYYVTHTPSLVDAKRRVCVIMRPKSSSNFFTPGEWSSSLTTRLIDAINYVRNLTTYEESPPPARNYTCNRLNVLCWLQGESDAPRDGNVWAEQFIKPTMSRIMTDTGTPLDSANFLLGNILSMNFQRFCDLNVYTTNGNTPDADQKFLTLSRDIDRFNTINNIEKDSSNIERYKPRPVSSFGLHAIDEEVPNASILSTASGDADNGASIHFSARSLRIYARRFFYAYLESIGKAGERYGGEPYAAFAPAPITYSSLIRNIKFISTATSYRYKNNPVAYFVTAFSGSNLTSSTALTSSESSRYAIISEYATNSAVYVPYLRNLTDNKFGVSSSTNNASVRINGVNLSGVRFYRTNRSYTPEAGAMDITFDSKELTASLGTFLKEITGIVTGDRTWTTLTYSANLSFTIEPLVYDAESGTHSNQRARIKMLPPVIGLYHDSFITPLISSNAPGLVRFGTLSGWVSSINGVTASDVGSQSTSLVLEDDILGNSGSKTIIGAGFYRNSGFNAGAGITLTTKGIKDNANTVTYAIIGTNTPDNTATAIENLKPALSRDAFPYAVGLWNPGDGSTGDAGRGYLYNRIRGALFDDMLFFSAGRILTVSKTPTSVNNGGARDNSTSYGYQYAMISQLGADTDPNATVNLRTMLGISSGTRVPYFSLANTGTAVALRIRNVVPNQDYTLSYWFSVRSGRVPYFNTNAGSDPSSLSGTLHMYLTNYLPVTIRTANPSSADNIIYVTGVDVDTDEIYISSVANDPTIFGEIYFETTFNGVSRFTKYYIFSVISVYSNLFKIKISRFPGDDLVSLTGSTVRGLSIKGKIRIQSGSVTPELTISATGATTLESSVPLVSDFTVIYVKTTSGATISSHSITNSQLTSSDTRVTYTLTLSGGSSNLFELGEYVTITGHISGKLKTYNVTNSRIIAITSTSFSVSASAGYTEATSTDGPFTVRNVLPAGFYYMRNPVKGSGNNYTTYLSLTRGGNYLTFYPPGFTVSDTNTLLYTNIYSNASTEFLRVGYPSSGYDSTTEQRIYFSRGSDSSDGNKSNVYVHGNTANSWNGRWTNLKLDFTTPDYTASDAFSSAYLQLGPLPMIRSNVSPITIPIVANLEVTNTYVEYSTQSPHGLKTGDIIMSVSGFTGVHSHFNFNFQKPVVLVSSQRFRVANDFAMRTTTAYTSSVSTISSLLGSPIVTYMDPSPNQYEREFIATTFNFAGFELTVR